MFNRDEKILLGLLAFIHFSHIVDFMIMMPLGPQFFRVFAINPHQFGLLVSAYTFSAGGMALVSALFADKFDRKTVLLYFYIGFAISTIACALSPNYVSLLLARIVAGAFGGVLSSLILAIVGDTFPPQKRGSAMGVLMMAFSMASVFGVPFALFLSNHFNWHAPFMFLGVVSLMVTFVIVYKIPSMTKHLEDRSTESSVQHFVKLVRDSNLIRALIFMFCLIMGQFSVIPFISPSLVANAGMTEAQLPLMYLFGGIATLFSSPWIGRLSDKHGKLKVFEWGVILSLVPLLWITHLKPSPIPLILTATVLLFVTMGGRMIPAMALVTSTVKPRDRGSFMSLNSAVQQLTCALAAYISGVLLVQGPDGRLENYNWVGWIAFGFSIVALFLVRRIKTVE